METDEKSTTEVEKESTKMDENSTELESNDKELSYNNGLDPLEVELISAAGRQEEEEMEEVSEEFSVNILEESGSKGDDESMTLDKSTTDMVVTNTSSTSNENNSMVPKMSREMRNLQKSTQDSKVLSNFLNEPDTPRVRRKPAKDLNSSTNESDTTFEPSMSLIIDSEMPLKGDKTENDSDSTVVVRDEGEKKRRRSVSRSRTRSKSIAGRSKSISRMLGVEMAAASDKDDNREDEDIDDLSSISLSTAIKPIENRAPNPPPKPGWDSFCFKCHLDNAVLSLCCHKCRCSFHRHCARLLYTPIPKNTDDFVCADCLEIEKIENGPVNKYNHAKIDLHTLKEMLLTILEKIRTFPDGECYENDIQFRSNKETNQPLITTQISLKTIEERILSNYYKVSEAFVHDVRQLEHNWTIIDKNKIKSLKNILKFVATEIQEMEACVHCYSSSYVISNWFTIPCKRPHLLIWAKLKGYPYWPAKVMSIDNQKMYADVRFFGAHDRAWVSASQCLLFSEKDPNKLGKTSTPNTNAKATSKSTKGIVDAMKEKDEYIANVREKYGFRYSTTKELLDPNLFQKQLEDQLPGLKKDTNGSAKADGDHSQKEKLTLKIVKTSDGIQTIEQKTPRIEKDRNILYTVLSKTEDGSESSDQSRVKAIILKRNKDVEKEKQAKKTANIEDSETSESNVSLADGKLVFPRRKSTRDVSKVKKSSRSISSRSSTPEPSKKKTKIAEVQNENEIVNEMVPEKPPRRSRKSVLQEKKESPGMSFLVPSGTTEIYALRDSPSPFRQAPSTKPNSNILSRSKSVDKESVKNEQKMMMRRLSIASSTVLSSRASNKHTNAAKKQRNSIAGRKRSGSQSRKETVVFNPDIIIKDEPMTDEEVVQLDRVTVNDIADLVAEGSSNKRKTILISTSDNSNDSFPQKTSRARKTFPNSLPMNRLADALQAPRTTNAMVCIPQVFPSEAPKTNNVLRVVNGELSTQQHQQPQPPQQQQQQHLERMSITPSSSVQSNNSDMIVRIVAQNPELPRLAPKPTGVFSNEGNVFQPESGAVSALFSENAHRMTDYFKSLLIDTIGAIASGVSDAQNVLLKLEIEKMKQQMNNIKAEHQMKIDKLKKDHADEMRLVKLTCEEKIKNNNQTHDQEKIKLITEIRQQCEIEKQRAIEAAKREIKRVTWCSNCPKEARFYCCWNTSYCGPACQKNHWQNHQKYCTNRNSAEGNSQNSSNGNNRQQDTSTPMASPSQTSSYIPVTISVPAFKANSKIANYLAAPKTTSPQILSSTTAPISTSAIQPDSTMRTPASALVQTSQKMIQPLMPPAYVYQQHKIPAGTTPASMKAISSKLATEDSLASNLQNNVVIRTITPNQALTVVSGGGPTNEIIINSIQSNGTAYPTSSPKSTT